jgi:hypothetical protein
MPIPLKMRKPLAMAVGAAWLCAIVTGTVLLAAYSNAPGKSGSPPKSWPRLSRLSRTDDKPTLIMFMHPRCPCSRASIGELALLMAHCQGKVNAKVLFIQPTGMAPGWVETDTWRDAAQIPGVTVLRDNAGREARLFGAETSGDTLLYDAQGRLMFHGGIIIARGHSGDNPGRDALQTILSGQAPGQTHTPAFGCSLFECKSESAQ